VRIAKEFGKEVANPSEARNILGLKGSSMLRPRDAS
jgi:hypothetical protein